MGRICDAYSITGIDEFPRQGLQTVVFGCYLYRGFAEHLDAATNSKAAVADVDIEGAIVYLARNLSEGGQRRSHLDEFDELLSEAAASDYLEEDEHYTFVYRGEEREEVRVNIN